MKLKKGIKRLLIILAILILVGAGVATYYLATKEEKVEKVKVLKEIKEYGYTLKDNQSARYKKLFEELDKVLSKKEVDEKEYVELISKMFVLDFYSLNEKVAKTDVGGTDFVHKDALDSFLNNAEDTLYKYIESNIYNERKQSLPTVKEVKVGSIETRSFDYLETTDGKAYEVTVNWTYQDESKASGYQNEATLIFVHNGKRLDLVELK